VIGMPSVQDIATAARAALDEIYDPCSVAAGRPLGLAEMGLVQSVDVAADGEVSIVLRTTFPGCTMIPMLAGAVEERIRALPNVTDVAVSIDPRFTWTPAAIGRGPGERTA
jgi:metal-sulfur cluster biosynthetic enzyme